MSVSSGTFDGRRLSVVPTAHMPDYEAPPVRFTRIEARIWYRLWAAQGAVVNYQELLTITWGHDYLWDDPDYATRDANRGLLRNRVHLMNRLLAAHGQGWSITSRLGVGYSVSKSQ